MQWYEHTPPARMRLILEGSIGESLSRDERNGVDRERFICNGCGEESFWAVYDPRHPIAGCANSDCRVDARMGLFDALTHFWDGMAYGELPEERSERKKRLGQALGELSDFHLRNEEAAQGEELEQERRGRRQSEKKAGEWRANAEQWQAYAQKLETGLEELERAHGALRENLHSAVDRKALGRGLTWGTVSFVLVSIFLLLFLRRAGAEMLFDWGGSRSVLYVMAVAGICSYVAFSSIYQGTLKARQNERLPLMPHEMLDWRVGANLLQNIFFCLVVPYILVGLAGGAIDRLDKLGPLSGVLSPGGIEWLLLCTAAGALCVILLGVRMSEDLRT